MGGGFWREAAAEPDHVAVVEADGTEHSAGAVLERCNRLSHVFRSLGAERGDRVAVLLPNCVEFIEAYLAASQVGLYLTAINWHLKASEVSYILENSGAEVFISHERFAETAVEAGGSAGLDEASMLSVGPVPSFTPLEELTRSQPGDAPKDRSAGWIMLYTGGTTGRPKGVRRPLMDTDPDSMGAMLTALSSVFGMEPGPGVHLVTGPLYHSAPLAFGLVTSLHLGQTIALMDRWTPEGTLEAIQDHRVTSSHLVPTMFNRLLRLPDDIKRSYDTSSLQLVIHGAAPCPLHIKKAMIEWWGPILGEYYAGTEGGGTYVTSEEWLERPGTVGRPMPGVQLKVLDDSGNECSPGEVGTVYMTTLLSDFEYHQDAEMTAAAKRDELFTLGDMGYLDDEGYLFLADRKVDMIISGGVNIYPAEVEGVLIAHPAVADCAVIGVPNEEWGEEVKAVVAVAPGTGAGEGLEQELIQFCRDQIAHYKCPRSVDFRNVLPRNDMGKLSKRLLRQDYWRGHERAI